MRVSHLVRPRKDFRTSVIEGHGSAADGKVRSVVPVEKFSLCSNLEADTEVGRHALRTLELGVVELNSFNENVSDISDHLSK